MIVFIRSNPVVSDPRVSKEVRSLSTHGFKVTVLAWDRKGLCNKFESSDYGIVLRLRLPVPYAKAIVPVYYPFFWLWVLSKLLKIQPTIIHACDIDTIFPALLYRFLRRKTKVILDIFDSMAMMVLGRGHQLLGTAVMCLERFIVTIPDALIAVSKGRLDLYNGVKLKTSETIMNFPDLDFITNLGKIRIVNRSEKTFRVVYAGVIWPYRGLTEVAEATKGINNIEFMVAGRIMDHAVFDSLMRFLHVAYCGELTFNESLALESSADVLPVFYDLNSPSLRFLGLSPNKLYEAMMLGIPIITNLKSALQEADCGIFAEYGDISAIKKAMIYLKDHPDIRFRLGQNGKRAFERNFNWKCMETKLIALYQELINEG